MIVGMVVLAVVLVVAATIMRAARSLLELGLGLRDLLLARGADRAHLNLEFYRLSRERVVRVDDEAIRQDLNDTHRDRLAVRRLSHEFVARHDMFAVRDVGLVDLEDALVVVISKRVARLDRELTTIALMQALERSLEAREDLRVTVDVRERLARRGAIDSLAILVEEDVREGDHGVRTNRGGRHGALGLPRPRRAFKLPRRPLAHTTPAA